MLALARPAVCVLARMAGRTGTLAGMKEWQGEILLVDDDAGNLLALEALLEPLGQQVLRARSRAKRRCASR